jgi:hypothetical protein
LSSDRPNTDSPANVDAAKEAREDNASKYLPTFVTSNTEHLPSLSLQEKGQEIGQEERGGDSLREWRLVSVAVSNPVFFLIISLYLICLIKVLIFSCSLVYFM